MTAKFVNNMQTAHSKAVFIIFLAEKSQLGVRIMELLQSADKFINEISELIGLETEGEYWDFKSKWYGNKASLLIDIICMGNNLANHDGYIIIGVNDSKHIPNPCEIVGVDIDENRKDQNELIVFLRDKKFFGGMRPTVYLKSITVNNKTIDVIVVKNTIYTPYYLIEPFRDRDEYVTARHIYTRIGDTNTPKDKTADIDKEEYLWKKRFGINLTPLEKAKFLLYEPKNWYPLGTDGQHSNIQYTGQYYHKQFPEFTLIYKLYIECFVEGKIDSVEQDIYWMNKLPRPLHNSFCHTLEIRYHATVLYSTSAIFADNYRFQRVLWKKIVLFQNKSDEYISYCYIEQDNIDFMLDKWLCNSHETVPEIEYYSIINPLEPWLSQPEYKAFNPYSVVPVFKNSAEHTAFQSFVRKNQKEFLCVVGDYSFESSPYKSSHAQCSAPDYINYLCICGETLVQWLDTWRTTNKPNSFV